MTEGGSLVREREARIRGAEGGELVHWCGRFVEGPRVTGHHENQHFEGRILTHTHTHTHLGVGQKRKQPPFLLVPRKEKRRRCF